MWPFGGNKQGVVVHHWAVVTSSGNAIASFRVREVAAGYTMTHESEGSREVRFSDSSNGQYRSVALAYEAMVGFCVRIVYLVWDASVAERESGVKAEIQEPKVVHVVEVLPDVNRAMPLAQIRIHEFEDGLDLARVDFADPTTREPINPPRATTLATAGPQ